MVKSLLQRCHGTRKKGFRGLGLVGAGCGWVCGWVAGWAGGRAAGGPRGSIGEYIQNRGLCVTLSGIVELSSIAVAKYGELRYDPLIFTEASTHMPFSGSCGPHCCDISVPHDRVREHREASVPRSDTSLQIVIVFPRPNIETLHSTILVLYFRI